MIKQALIEEITGLDPVPVECDGFVRLVITALSRHNQEYKVYCGSVKTSKGDFFRPHYWVEWNDQIIDFRARMWLGQDCQHGFLDKREYNELYDGEEVCIAPLAPVMEQILKTPFPADLMEQLRYQIESDSD